MSRSKAKENLVLADEIKLLDDQGIIHGIRDVSDLDEAPSSYKNIDEVMENQKDLVDIVITLQPLAVIKG
jgi:tRNA-splicing ligase RtcB